MSIDAENATLHDYLVQAGKSILRTIFSNILATETIILKTKNYKIVKPKDVLIDTC